MRRQLLDLLSCPECQSDLSLEPSSERGAEVIAGVLHCASCRNDFPIIGAIPRFVPPTNYADNFGLQWNLFRQTQLDSHSGTRISEERFFKSSGWTTDRLRGRVVLDVGCGAGRFAEIALSAGATVVALDYSSAVDACYANLGSSPSLEVIQGDIYRLPFKQRAFDFIYCFGVLQHTPDVRRAFMALPGHLKKGGFLAVDVYPKVWRNIVIGKYWIRPLTKRLPKEKLFRMVKAIVPRILPAVKAAGRIPLLGRVLRALIPISNYDGVFTLDSSQLREWAVLDTYDMLAPAHDHPQSEATLVEWFKEARLQEFEVLRLGHLVGRGRK